MRVISISTLADHWKRRRKSEEPLRSWYQEVEKSSWKSPNDLKSKYRNASIISKKRVVFNIKGNDFRLVVDIEYRLGIIFIVWIGTHKEYDTINVRTIKYVKANKK